MTVREGITRVTGDRHEEELPHYREAEEAAVEVATSPGGPEAERAAHELEGHVRGEAEAEALRGDAGGPTAAEYAKLPDRLEDFTTILTTGDIAGRYRLLDGFGLVQYCDRCRRPLVNPELLLGFAADRYAITGEQRIGFEQEIAASGLEFGDNLSPNYCSEHAQITSE
jgi:hypothetical protein